MMKPGIIELILTKTFEGLGLKVEHKATAAIQQFVKNIANASDKSFLHLKVLDKFERGFICCYKNDRDQTIVELWLETGETDRGNEWQAAMKKIFPDIFFTPHYRNDTQELKRQENAN